jgi:hypothetical protein
MRPVVTELFHADEQTDEQAYRRTDSTKLIVVFSNFANAPKSHKFYMLFYMRIKIGHSC